MKIVLINITGHYGSTGQIMKCLKSHYEQNGHSVRVLYGHIEKLNEEGYIQIDRPLESKLASILVKFGRKIYKGNPFSFYRIRTLLNEFSPNIVHIHCANGLLCNLFKLFKYLSKAQIKTVITHHAEFYYTGSCGYSLECKGYYTKQCRNCPRPFVATRNAYFANPHKNWRMMNDAIHSFEMENLMFTAVSPWVKERSLNSPITHPFRCEVVLNGVNTSVFKYDPDAKLRRGSTSLVDSNKYDHIVLHVTHLFDSADLSGIKGGGYIIKLAYSMPNIRFLIVASETVNVDNVPSNVIIHGRAQNTEELAALYSMADLTVISSKQETFSMIVAESLCCGTPIVGFKAGGPESITIPEYSQFVDYGDLLKLKQVIYEFLDKNFNRTLISKLAQSKYSYERMGDDYLNLYYQLNESK